MLIPCLGLISANCFSMGPKDPVGPVQHDCQKYVSTVEHSFKPLKHPLNSLFLLSM